MPTDRTSLLLINQKFCLLRVVPVFRLFSVFLILILINVCFISFSRSSLESQCDFHKEWQDTSNITKLETPNSREGMVKLCFLLYVVRRETLERIGYRTKLGPPRILKVTLKYTKQSCPNESSRLQEYKTRPGPRRGSQGGQKPGAHGHRGS